MFVLKYWKTIIPAIGILGIVLYVGLLKASVNRLKSDNEILNQEVRTLSLTVKANEKARRNEADWARRAIKATEDALLVRKKAFIALESKLEGMELKAKEAKSIEEAPAIDFFIGGK